jgi:RNA-binding protein
MGVITMSTTLNQVEKRQLMIKAQNIRPVVIIGAQGLTDAVQAEITRALFDHELIKIKVGADTRDERRKMIEAICEEQDAELIQALGHVAVIYKKRIK